MASVFAAPPIGTVVSVPSNQIMSATLLDVDGMRGALTRSIVTNFTFNENVNAQFTHTMGDDIYVNVFGNRIGQLNVTGLSFASTDCDTGSHGITDIINYYRRNRISSNSQPIVISIGGNGGITAQGALIGANYSATNPETMMVQYNLTIVVVPK